MPVVLQEKDRQKLDGIVSQMIANKEPEENIQFVVGDFKAKYGQKKSPVGSPSVASSPVSTPSSGTGEGGLVPLDVSPEQAKKYEENVKKWETQNGYVATIEEDPLANVTAPYKKEAIERYTNFQKGNEKARSETTGQKYLSKTKQDNINRKQAELNPSDELALGKFQKVKEQAENELFPNGQIAKQTLVNYAKHKGISLSEIPSDNETIKAAKRKSLEYDLDAEDIAATNSVLDAAIRSERRNNKNFDAQVSELEKGFPNNMGDYKSIIPEPLFARIVDKFLAKGNAGLIAQNDPDLKDQYDKLKDGGILLQFPSYGATVVANEMSREREAQGKNNWLGNFKSQDYMDALAEKMYKDSPAKKKIYDEIVGRDLKKYIDAPGFLEHGVGGVKHAFEGMGNTVEELAGKDNALALYEDLEKDNTQVSSQPKKFIHQLSSTGGDFGGLIAAMGVGGSALKGIGVLKGSNSLMTGLTFYGDELSQARKLYPDDPTKQKIRAGISTAAFIALNPLLQGSKSLQKKFFEKLTPEIDDAIKQVEAGAITMEAARDGLMGKVKDAIDHLGDAGKKTATGTADMLAFTVIKQATDKLLGLNPQTYKEVHPENEDVDVAKMTAMGVLLPSLVTASGGRKFAKESLFEISRNEKRYHNVAEVTGIIDPDFGANAKERHENITFLSGTKELLDEVGLPDNLQKSYLLHAMNEKILTKKAESITEPTLKKQINDQIKRSQEAKEKILKGENIDSLPQEVNTDNLSEHEKFLKEMFDGDEDGSWLKAADQKLLGGKSFDKSKVPQFLETVAMQSNNVMRGKDGELMVDETFDSRGASAERWDKAIIDAANEMYPEIKKMGDTQGEFTGAIKEKKQEAAQPKQDVVPPYPLEDKEKWTSMGEEKNKGTLTYLTPDDFLSREKALEMTEDDRRRIDKLKTHIQGGGKLDPLKIYYNGKSTLGANIDGRHRAVAAKELGIKEVPVIDYTKQQDVVPSAEEKKSSISVIKPGEIKHPETITIKPKANAIPERGAEEVPMGETPRDSGEVGVGVPQSKETTGTQEEGKGSGEGEKMRLAHADTEKIYEEANLPKRLETPTKHHEQLEKEADEILSKGYDFDKVAEETMTGKRKWEDTDQALFARKVADLKAKQNNLSVTDPEFDRLQNEIEKLSRASDVAGTISARHMESRKGYRPVEESISDAIMNEKEITKTDILTDKQKETVEREFKEEQKADMLWKEKYAKLKEEHDRVLAEKELKKTTQKTKPVKKDFKAERADLLEQLKAKKEKHLQWLKDQGIQQQGVGGFVLTTDMAKVIGKIVKSHVEEILEKTKDAVIKLEDVVKRVHGDIRDIFPDVTEKDIQDVIGGKYSETKTRKDLAIAVQDLRTEANLIEKLDNLLNGKEPASEKKKRKRNKQITDLENQIKDIKSFDAEAKNKALSALKQKARGNAKIESDLNKAEKEIDSAEEKEAKRLEKESTKATGIRSARQESEDLAAYKKRAADQINKIEAQIKSGNFAPDVKKEPLKLDAEAIRLKDRLIKIRNEKKLRQLRQFYANQSAYERNTRALVEIANIPRAIMATLDFSALLRQAVIPTISRPRTAIRIEKGRFEGSIAEMFRGASSQRLYDRWFADLAESKRFEDMKKSKLAITDSTDPRLQAREEQWMSGLADKIPLVGGTLIKGSERAYSMGLNKIRVDLYNRFADAMESRGKTVENSPKMYEQMAAYINNATGRGDLGGFLNKSAPFLNAVFFSPRLIASRVNMLTYWAQMPFRRQVPKEIVKAYFADMVKFVGIGVTVLALAKLNGLDVEADPRSSDFGKIRDGNTRWDIWGGFQQYARAVAQIWYGESKSATTGNINKLDGEGKFGKDRVDVLLTMGRGKLAPIPSMIVDLATGRNIVGEKIKLGQWTGDINDPDDNSGKGSVGSGEYLGQHFLPLNLTSILEAVKEEGAKAWMTVGIPSTFGVGVQTFSPTQSDAKIGQQRQQRQTSKQNQTR